eukprot:1801845-Rhodomonas_salina.1
MVSVSRSACREPRAQDGEGEDRCSMRGESASYRGCSGVKCSRVAVLNTSRDSTLHRRVLSARCCGAARSSGRVQARPTTGAVCFEGVGDNRAGQDLRPVPNRCVSIQITPIRASRQMQLPFTHIRDGFRQVFGHRVDGFGCG